MLRKTSQSLRMRSRLLSSAVAAVHRSFAFHSDPVVKTNVYEKKEIETLNRNFMFCSGFVSKSAIFSKCVACVAALRLTVRLYATALNYCEVMMR